MTGSPPDTDSVGGDGARAGEFATGLAAGLAAAGKTPGSTFSLAVALFEQELGRFNGSTEPAIEVLDGPDQRKRLALTPGRTYVLGRDRVADLPLTEPKASRRHTQITLRDGSLWVRDLGSSNGTFLGAERLRANTDLLWPVGATLHIGGDAFIYRNPPAEVLAELERRASALAHVQGSADDSRLDDAPADDGTALTESRTEPTPGRALAAKPAQSAEAPVSEPPPASRVLRDGTQAPVAASPPIVSGSNVGAESPPVRRKLPLFEAFVALTVALVLIGTGLAIWLLVS